METKEVLKEQVQKLMEVLSNKKALDVVGIYIADRTIIADWMIVCSGRVSAQVKALCDEVEKKAQEYGLVAKRTEGYNEGRWIVIDFSSILIHIFHPEEREYYNIERLWVDDPRNVITISDDK